MENFTSLHRSRSCLVILACLAWGVRCAPASGQWRAPAGAVTPATATTPTDTDAPTTARGGFVRDGAPLSLDGARGQVWRQYDLRAYTSRREGDDRPEQAVIDWVLRETGTDAWFGEPAGLLSANRTTLRVYHTPEVQAKVEDIVRRFVEGNTSEQVFGVRLMTVLNPNWRQLITSDLRPLSVQTPGVQAWITSRENAAVLLDGLRSRADYREHNTPQMVVQSGQLHTIERTRPLAYIRDLLPRTAGPVPGFDLDMGQVEEGFSLQLSPLLSADGQHVDAALKLETSHVEKLTPVWLNTPSPSRARQTTQIQVPQTASWRLHERFRWPADQVLVVSCGLVANPGAERKANSGLAGGLLAGPTRTEALLMLEAKGRVSDPLAEPRTAVRTDGINYRGRY